MLTNLIFFFKEHKGGKQGKEDEEEERDVPWPMSLIPSNYLGVGARKLAKRKKKKKSQSGQLNKSLMQN